MLARGLDFYNGLDILKRKPTGIISMDAILTVRGLAVVRSCHNIQLFNMVRLLPLVSRI